MRTVCKAGWGYGRQVSTPSAGYPVLRFDLPAGAWWAAPWAAGSKWPPLLLGETILRVSSPKWWYPFCHGTYERRRFWGILPFVRHIFRTMEKYRAPLREFKLDAGTESALIRFCLAQGCKHNQSTTLRMNITFKENDCLPDKKTTTNFSGRWNNKRNL